MRSSSSHALDQTRGVHRSKRTKRINLKQISETKMKFKIYQLMLFFICVSMIYYWHKSFLCPEDEPETVAADSNEVTYPEVAAIEEGYPGLVHDIMERVVNHAVRYFIMFITEPFNLTLIMVCLFSRIVLNFVTFHFTFTVSEFICGYEIDKDHYVASLQSIPPVDV